MSSAKLNRIKPQAVKMLNQLEFSTIWAGIPARRASEIFGEKFSKDREFGCPNHIILCIISAASQYMGVGIKNPSKVHNFQNSPEVRYNHHKRSRPALKNFTDSSFLSSSSDQTSTTNPPRPDQHGNHVHRRH
jgi:hypothetical protein